MIIGCENPQTKTQEQHDPHVLKMGRSYNKLITGPFFWAQLQFTNGGILAEGENPADFPICYANADINGDGQSELLIRDNVFGVNIHRVMVFSREGNSYRYLGDFEVGMIVVLPENEPGIIETYLRCGFDKVVFVKYKLDNSAGKFVIISKSKEISTQPSLQEDRMLLSSFVNKQNQLQWTKY